MHENLEKKIRESGIKKTILADKLEITLTSFNNKMSGRTAFYVHEAFKLMSILGINENEMSFYFG